MMKAKLCNLCKAKMHFYHDLMLCAVCDEKPINAMGLRKDA
jgi:hypothetical protein